MKRRVWAALALAVLAVGPAGCGEQPTEAEAKPVGPAGISAANGRIMLSAVSGNPAAAYFDVTNGGDHDWMIRATSVEGAKGSTMHVTDGGSMQETLQVMVKGGETVKFEPGGLHVMVDGLPDTAKAGTKTDVTLTFVGGDKVTFPAEIRAAGDDR
ncbi:MAG: copper chaperone PCu(A)C [Porphyrobacter sp.]|nr:copper chaperone PCu(A)C [Porphyrobacter sp.]